MKVERIGRHLVAYIGERATVYAKQPRERGFGWQLSISSQLNAPDGEWKALGWVSDLIEARRVAKEELAKR